MLKRRFVVSLLLVASSFLIVSPIAIQAQVTTSTFLRNLTMGDSGTDVSSLQSFLIANGFLNVSSTTGFFGPLTRSAVIGWQIMSGLPSTGFFGPLSRAKVEGTASNVATTPPPQIIEAPLSSSTPTTYTRNLTIGDSGTDVSSLQSFLITGGFLDVPSPTGYFGALTSAAVAKWQAGSGLPSTGFFGPLSRADITASTSSGQASTANNSISAPNTSSYITPTSTTTSTLPAPLPVYTGGGGGGGGGGGSAPAAPSTPPPDTTLPTIFITNPTQSSTVSGIVTVSVNASDNVGVIKVEFYVDGALKFTNTVAPYNFQLNTTPLTHGIHTLSAQASDAAGNIGISPNISINVIAPTPTMPTNLVITGTTSSTISFSWFPSTESGGTITGYRIYRGGAEIGTDTNTAFTDADQLTASTTYIYTIAAVDAAGTLSKISSPISGTTLADTAPTLDYNFGLSMAENFPNNATLDDMVSLHIGWIRFDMEWSNVQSINSSTFNWVDIDNLVADATAHHIKLLPILDYTPSWEVPAGCTAPESERCAPADPAAFANFAKAAVARYTPEGIVDWEIWNEPNLQGSWQPAVNPAAYTTLLKDAYTAIKSVNPNAFVITGGMAPATSTDGDISPTSFLTQMYTDGAKNYFNAVGFHPYSYPAMPSYYQIWNAWQQIASTTPSLRSIMTANGDSSKQIWLTEYGAPTGGPGLLESSANDILFTGHPDHVTEALQAAMLSQAVGDAANFPWAGPLFWYSYKDLGTSTSTNENFFGILRYDGSEKPAYTTIKDLLGS